MALFSEGQPGSDADGSLSRQPRSREERRVRKGWYFLGVAVVSGLVLGLVPAPYVIEQPGPVFDTLGTAEHDGVERPLISIPDEPTYPTEGELNLLTVSVVGNPESRPNWFEVLGAWASPQKAVLPIDLVFPPNVTTTERDQANQAAMVNSQQDAIAAALLNLGYDVGRTLEVNALTTNSPAEGVLEPGDVIVSVNGDTSSDLTDLRAAVKANGTEKPATLEIIRAGQTQTVEVTPTMSGDAVVLGVAIATNYTFPIDVQIQLDNVGGPSAGMMFALGIIDKLTPGPLTAGTDWAGTGTIDDTGTVGPIGGIRQKMFGALDAGSKWFLAPESNCGEVVGHIPDGLTVFSVETLDQALTAIETVSDGGDTSKLPSCTLPASAP
ncbi:YlbL family protein [Microterricola viridarii]|uniref:endopeptidase La n=1 Tax=Microterricola viridarii TaxID=412690 RepID=A0A0Y0MHZ2_9MICO|nr:S16 family serine protease [Microterricola viridarii]AMB58015.1 ATP-dependent serine peptidase containing a PDZ domain protein [Microterricola viridarii]